MAIFNGKEILLVGLKGEGGTGGQGGGTTIKVNGVDQEEVLFTSDPQTQIDSKQPKGNYALKNEIPTSLSALQADAQHRVVTDTQINTWNGKSNFSGNYNDLSNKPTIPSNSSFTLAGLSEKSYNSLTDKPTIPTKTSQITNDSDFATNSKVNQAIETSKTYTDEQIAKFDFIKVVSELPQTGVANKIYMVAKASGGTQDLFDEYVWVNEKWEYVGTKTVEVDLTDYYTKKEIQEIYYTKSSAEIVHNRFDNAIFHKQDKRADNLKTSAKEIVPAINELLSSKAQGHDNNLKTTDKTVTGAINEIYDMVKATEKLTEFAKMFTIRDGVIVFSAQIDAPIFNDIS